MDNIKRRGKANLVDNPHFKDAVRRVFKANNITSKEIADKLNISVSSLNMQINANPSVNLMRSIAGIVGCDLMDFFKEEAEQNTVSREEDIPCHTSQDPISDKLDRLVDTIALLQETINERDKTIAILKQQLQDKES